MNISQMQLHISCMLWVMQYKFIVYINYIRSLPSVGWMPRSLYLRGLGNTWRIVYWPCHAYRCVTSSMGDPVKTPHRQCKFDMATGFRWVGIPPKWWWFSSGIPPKMPLIQGLGVILVIYIPTDRKLEYLRCCAGVTFFFHGGSKKDPF